MEFTTSDGQVISENDIFMCVSRTIKTLKQNDGFIRYVIYWERELLEWFLDKEIETIPIELHKNITEKELEQLEQLKDYLEL